MIEAVCANWQAWREAARRALALDTPPDAIRFRAAETPASLFAEPLPEAARGESLRVPRAFMELAKLVAMHRDPERFNLLYAVLYRITHGEHHLVEDAADPEVRTLRLMERAVDEDIHHVHAFVRFRRVHDPEGERFVAWYKPDHFVLEAAAPFFARRFEGMRWAILTPDSSAYWDQQELRFGPGAPRSEAPSEDSLESLWSDYYSSIFNPARLSVSTMTSLMPTRHWSTMPETNLIPQLVHSAEGRVVQMGKVEAMTAAPFIPKRIELPALRAAAQGCEGCDLYRHATQTVFGEGPPKARVVMVGEQPGDQVLAPV